MKFTLKRIIVAWSFTVILIIFLLVSIYFFTNNRSQFNADKRIWNSLFTEKEHLEKVNNIMVKIYGDDVKLTIYTLYSFDEHPEYYLVEIPEEDEHRIVLCYKDEYYDFHVGQGLSWWARQGIIENDEYKKYAGPTSLAYKYNGAFYGQNYGSGILCNGPSNMLDERELQDNILFTKYVWGWWNKLC